MSPTTSTRPSERRSRRRPVDKFGERRRELAAAAQTTLSTRGYAGTSLRDIANNSDFSHGVLHYYFEDKDELIAYCVTLYKEECADRYDEILATSTTADELLAGFRGVLVDSLRDEGHLHRLWYDLRNQSIFDAAFRDDVVAIDQALQAMIWRVIERYAELSGTTVDVTAPAAYAMLDGLFQQGLVAQAFGDDLGDALGDAAIDAIARFCR